MVFHRVVFVITLLALGCAATNAQSAGADAARQQLARLAPDPLPAGVTAQGTASFYTPDNLYQYMDGGADIFLVYGVQTLLHMDLHAGAADIALDIFDMGSPDTAFGMYAAERVPDEPYIRLGAEGYANHGSLDFYQDRYYIKLTAVGEGADPVLETLARAVSAKIGTNPAPPALLATLPAENRKAHSEQYMPNAPLGHDFLGPAYAATYVLDGKESKIFVTLAGDEADAQKRFQQLEQSFTKSGQVKPAPEIAAGAILVSNSYEGSVAALVKGRYLILLAAPTPQGEELLKRVSELLK
jgi:hypothetical protein